MRPEESFQNQSVRSLQTMLQVISMADPRLPMVIPDGIFGPTTRRAVSEFQRFMGLPVTGIADQATWDAIVPVYTAALLHIGPSESIDVVLTEILRPGMASPWLYPAQAILLFLAPGLGQSPGPAVTGFLDEATEKALLALQKVANLPRTGCLDAATWRSLSHLYTLQALRQSGEN